MNYFEFMKGGRNYGRNIMFEVAEGNPGCLQFLLELREIGMLEMATITLYEKRITGSRAYQLWNDCCDRKTNMAAEVLMMLQSGQVSRDDVMFYVDRPRGLPIDMEKLREKAKMPKSEVLRASVRWRFDGPNCKYKQNMINDAYKGLIDKLFDNISEDAGKTFIVEVARKDRGGFDLGEAVSDITVRKVDISERHPSDRVDAMRFATEVMGVFVKDREEKPTKKEERNERFAGEGLSQGAE